MIQGNARTIIIDARHGVDPWLVEFGFKARATKSILWSATIKMDCYAPN